MRNYYLKAILKAALRVACLLPFVTVAALGQQQVNLTAGPATATLPDGTSVPMWGYSCGTAVTGSLASCAALNSAAGAGAWSPVVITVPTGQGLTINLTNNLSFSNGNTVPTSLVIVGQLGGGLGTTATSTQSPDHSALPSNNTSWPIAGGPGFTPPKQGTRVQSFSTEVGAGATTSLTWTAPRAGTYLIESGTHPSIQGPMGLYGMLVVTTTPAGSTAGTAYPAAGSAAAVTYNAEVPLLMSEIDPVQNKAVNTAVNTQGFSETQVWTRQNSGGPLTSLSLVSGGSGYLSTSTVTINGTGSGAAATVTVTFVVATASVVNGSNYTAGDVLSITGGGGSGATVVVDTVDSSGVILTSHLGAPGSGYTSTPTGTTGGTGSGAVLTATTTGTISSITLTNGGDGYTTASLPTVTVSDGSGATFSVSVTQGGCGGGAHTCYPPAVNYTPLYYLFNGAAFDKTNANTSLFSAAIGTATAPVAGNVLVRFVNAGLRMHIPSIVGSVTGTPAVGGFSLIAEDGNVLPGVPRVQSEVFMAAGKTYDVMINVPASGGNALPVYDRELSLSANATARDAGMLAYIGINGSVLPVTGVFANAGAVARDDTYNSLIAGQTLTVSDASKGVIANDTNVAGVQLLTVPTNGTVTLNPDGTFTYVPSGTATSDSFTYCANGPVTGTTCSSKVTATVTLGKATIEDASGITCTSPTYSSTVATSLSIKSPGVLSFCKDAVGYPLTVNAASVTPVNGLTLSVDKTGGFNASVPTAGTYTFSFKAQNSQGTVSNASTTATLVFPAGSGLAVTVLDGQDKRTQIRDYRWVIEEDRTFYVDPTNTTNNGTVIPTFGTNFHTSHMPLVATGCTGPLSCEAGQTVLGSKAVCDVGNGGCRPDTAGNGQTPVDPKDVALDPTKRYYISVLPGDAANPFNAAYAGPPDCTPAGVTAGSCGHGMGGAPIGAGQLAVKVLSQPTPNPPAKLTVFVFEDDYPLNGEHDASGGVDVLAPNEPGLGSFQITLFDDAGGTGDATGQPTYDMFNMPLSNSLAGQIDPVTGLDACPISAIAREGFDTATGVPNSPLGMTSMIVTCPKYESDGKTLSPLAGQAVVANLYQGRYGVVATPGADRIARGEEWLQTNTLDGQKAHDSFMRIGEPAYFQEFGPAGYHVSIGFANPKIINDRKTATCNALPAAACSNEVKGHVTTARMSRPPDERLYGSGSHDSYSFTQCYASLGDPDGADFAFVKCDDAGNFDFTGIPAGNFKVTIFDQWNDQVVDGISTPVGLAGQNSVTLDMGEIAAHQWQANIYTRTFFDPNYSGVPSKDQNGNDTSTGLSLVSTNIRFRDGSYSNFNNTDLSGNAGFNEIFPLFSWYTIETDSTRYKSTGTHVVVDAGGPTDGAGGGSSNIGNLLANTIEQNPLPANLRVPGAFYCANADCTDAPTPLAKGGSGGSTGRVDPPFWFGSYGWQGFSGQNSFLEFGKKPFAKGENGGIHGHVVYASTRPFDDPQLLLQLSWEPLVPHVRVNLYKEGVAPDGVTTTLNLVDYTDTSSFDDWAQGFRSDGVPNMNCPGQSSSDPFIFGLNNQPNYLDWYNSQHGGPAATSLPNNSQFKCYDGLHNWNQLQPAPYDGMYSFPSVTSLNPTTGKPAGSNCTGCIANPDTSDPYRSGTPMLPAGKYVVEVVVPPGYELVKEEDKNILIGDNYTAPVTQQFAGLGNIFIIPDQAAVGAAYNPNNPQNPTQDLGSTTFPRHEGDTGSVEAFWPCVGASRIIPDYISLFPQSAEVAPFAGATRNLCDRKEVTLEDQAAALAKFYIFTSTHIASHFTGVITDDFTAEFDPFSPQFGEKFAPANLPVSIKDWAGNEVARTYTDSWGAYNGLNYSTWEVNPPNPTGYGPTMMVMCMNDRGSGPIPDPLYQDAYSQFCYELPFMPGQTGYFDTPVVPTSAFAGAGYNNPDCAYPDTTPAIKEVDGAGVGPWVHIPSTSISDLNLLTAGAGYTSTFNFNITGNGGTGAAGHVTDLKLISIASIACNANGANACSNFASQSATIVGDGSGAAATATPSTTAPGASGTINFTVTSAGSGYTSRPTVTLTRANGTTRSVGSGNVSMGVNGVILIAYGSGYAGTSFTVNITQGGNGVGATATVSVSSTTDTLTITALGDQTVTNYGYSGPSATTAPYNQKIVTRHYGFGSTKGTVTIGGVNVPSGGITWSDSTIVLTVPRNVPPCAVQQQAQYGGLPAFCGELVITAANDKQSIDTVTVNIGGKNPIHVSASGTIQSAIDTAQPGDLIIVDPTCTAAATTVACTTTGATHSASAHNEMLLMWKPVRLQGVGAASSIVDANAHPAGKLDPWRQQVVCLFGLTVDGQPNTGDTTCMSGWTAASGGPNFPTMIVDRVPMEGILGWDASVNGNLAEQLIEPGLMGAYEGAAVTVLGKGVNIPAGGANAWGSGAESAFPDGSTLLTAADCATGAGGSNLYPSNFYCNPSSIDGLSLTNSSQGGGGIFVHAWAHNIQIANNRVHNNQGTLSGGVTIGQGEHIEVPLAGAATTIPPGSCETSPITNQGLPFCYDVNVNVHHNAITRNASLGDEIFSSTPAGAGGVTLCNGSDYYQFNYNWVCGNMSTGDGGGVAHIGWSKNGHIEHNTIVFNQSTNPTITTNGGGLLVMGAPDADPPCSTNDQDCVSPPGTIAPSDGTGPGLVINANLIQGNAADSGSGGGLRLQHINGTDVLNFPDGLHACANRNFSGCLWNTVTVTNNIINNNVAGWDGGGVSLLDALAVNIVNNTIVSNDSTASSGDLFGSLFAPLASAPGTTCTANNGSQSCPQVAGLVSVTNSEVLKANLPTTGFTCPPNHGVSDSCRNYSVPLLANDVIWQNRSFFIGVTPPTGTGPTNQQSTVALFNSFVNTPAASQTATGACPTASYWEIGVRGDTGPSNHASGFLLSPIYSVLTDVADYTGANNLGSNPAVVSQYCNGSRVPPENGGMGWQVPPGTNEGNALPTPVFSLIPSATVDEGNNWVNISWGPLSTTKPVTGGTLGDYELATGSPAINYIAPASVGGLLAPNTDFFGRNRPSGSGFDVGAVEWRASDAAPSLSSITPSSGTRGTTVQVTLIGADLTNVAAVNVSGTGVTVTVFNVISDSEISATFTISTTAALTARNVTVAKAGSPTSNPVTFTVVAPPAPTLTSIALNTGVRGTTVPVTLTGTNFTATGTSVAVAPAAGITVGSLTITSTSITTTFTIAGGTTAALGAHTVSVTTPGGTTGNQTFTVTGPTLTGITPAAGTHNTTVPVMLSGANLAGVTATGVSVSGLGVTCTVNTTTSNSTTVNANCVIANGAARTTRTVSVTTPIGTTNTVNFMVN